MRTVYYFIFSLLILLTCFVTESLARSDWEVKPVLTLAQSYDNNIYSQENNVEDYVTRVGANLSAIYSGADIHMLTNYSGTFNAYADHSELNVLTHEGRINVDMERWFQRRFRDGDFTITENFTWSPEIKDSYFDEVSEGKDPLSNLGLRTKRSDLYRNAVAIELGYPLSKRHGITVQYSNLLTLYSDPVLIDSETHEILLGSDIKFLKDALYGNVGASRINRGRVYSTSYSVTGGLRHTISPLSLLNANVGMEILDYNTGGNTSAMHAGLQFSRRARYVTLNAGYSRELNTASGVSTIPTLVDLFYVNTGIRHSVNLSSNFGVNYSVNKSTRGSEIDTSSYNLSAKLSYRFRPWLDGNVSVSHLNQSSESVGSPSINREQITFQVSFYPLYTH